MTRVLAINGSYRPDGAIDQAIAVAASAAAHNGFDVDIVNLRDFPIEFCRNCRACTQAPGEAPGECARQDGMAELIRKIEAADAYVFASPTNVGSVTAIFKRFMERLTPYAYWPWGAKAPVYRKQRATKGALLIASCAAPGWVGRLFYSTLQQLSKTARTVGARPLGTAFIGLVAQQAQSPLPQRATKRIQALVAKLAESFAVQAASSSR